MPEQEIIPPRGPGFQPGHERYGGRKPGQIGRHARLLKELILMAAELEGSDGEGRDGLLGYLRKIAQKIFGCLRFVLAVSYLCRSRPRTINEKPLSTDLLKRYAQT